MDRLAKLTIPPERFSVSGVSRIAAKDQRLVARWIEISRAWDFLWLVDHRGGALGMSDFFVGKNPNIGVAQYLIYPPNYVHGKERFWNEVRPFVISVQS